MEIQSILLISFTSLFASILTFFSGFGLGTILLPVFALFFELPIAVAMTAIVHFLNNSLKMSLLFKDINWNVIIKFGITALIGAFIGAYLLDFLNPSVEAISNHQISNYQKANNELTQSIPETNYLKIIIGSLICIFSVIDLLPNLGSKLSINDKILSIGGFISGFFGGLSGHQGALRSLFLIKLNLEKSAFIATGVFISIIIDISRISVYFVNYKSVLFDSNSYIFILVALISSIIGVFIGMKLLKKITIKILQYIVAFLLFVFGLLMIFDKM